MSALVLVIVACGEPDPVVSAVRPPSTVEEVAAKRAAKDPRTPEAALAAYTRAEGVYIDARLFGGRRWESLRDEVERQFGPVLSEELSTEPGADADDREVRLLRGNIRLHGGVIQAITIPLPEPLRRAEALAALGFPPYSGTYNAYTLEFRINNEWGFRRIRLFRADRGSEEITKVEVLKFSSDDR